LSADIYAQNDIPAFNQSSMDGYAFSYNDWDSKNKLIIQGEIPAGITEDIPLVSQQAIRIFTGGAVPAGADTVVMQEKIKVENNYLVIDDQRLKKGDNVRIRGAEIKKGTLALEKDSFLSPAAIGFLAGTGIADVEVYPTPSVAIISTGKELQQPGKSLTRGQVYESNSFTLKASLEQLNIRDVKIMWVDDKPELLQQVLADSLQNSDMILLTGGVSVGDYDFVLQAATQCGVEKIFHRIKQKPGKPLYFGKKQNQTVFGLPGNPASVLTCFYEYVLPAIGNMKACKPHLLQIKNVELFHGYKKPPGLTHFLKGVYSNEKVKTLDAQESYRMSSFSKANCLICLDEEKQEWKAGDKVEIHLLPF